MPLLTSRDRFSTMSILMTGRYSQSYFLSSHSTRVLFSNKLVLRHVVISILLSRFAGNSNYIKPVYGTNMELIRDVLRGLFSQRA